MRVLNLCIIDSWEQVIVMRTDTEAEVPILWPLDAESWLMGKTLMLGEGAGGERTTEDEMAGWHHRLNGHEFEQVPGAGDGQDVLQSMGLRRVGLDWATELNWADCCEGCPVHYGMFNTFLEPCPLDTSSTLPPPLHHPQFWQTQQSLDVPGQGAGWEKSSYIENHWSKK